MDAFNKVGMRLGRCAAEQVRAGLGDALVDRSGRRFFSLLDVGIGRRVLLWTTGRVLFLEVLAS